MLSTDHLCWRNSPLLLCLGLLHLLCFSVQLVVADMLLLLPQQQRVSLLNYVLLKNGAGYLYTLLLPFGCLVLQVFAQPTNSRRCVRGESQNT